jgi:hypothetical protein
MWGVQDCAAQFYSLFFLVVSRVVTFHVQFPEVVHHGHWSCSLSPRELANSMSAFSGNYLHLKVPLHVTIMEREEKSRVTLLSHHFP